MNLPQLVWLLGWYTLCVFSLVSIPSDDQRYFLLGEKCGVGVGGKEHACLLGKQNSQCLFFFFSPLLNLIISVCTNITQDEIGGKGMFWYQRSLYMSDHY